LNEIDKPLKVIVAVDRSACRGEVYLTTGNRKHVAFTNAVELMRVLLATVAIAEKTRAPRCVGECDWNGLRQRSQCDHVSLACNSCEAVWCPCEGWMPAGDPDLMTLMALLAAA
jgi:hypothetical protein